MSRGQSYNSPGALLSHKFPRPTLCAAANNTSLINPPPVCPNQMASQPKSCFNVNCPRHKGTCKGQNVGDGVGSSSLWTSLRILNFLEWRTMWALAGSPSDVGHFHDPAFLSPSFDHRPTLHIWRSRRWSHFLTRSHRHDWPNSLEWEPSRGALWPVWEKLFRMIHITVGFPGRDCRPECCLVLILWRQKFVAGVRLQILHFPLHALSARPIFCGIGIPFTKALRHVVTGQPSLFGERKHGWWRAEKGTKGRSGVCWSRI